MKSIRILSIAAYIGIALSTIPLFGMLPALTRLGIQPLVRPQLILHHSTLRKPAQLTVQNSRNNLANTSIFKHYSYSNTSSAPRPNYRAFLTWNKGYGLLGALGITTTAALLYAHNNDDEPEGLEKFYKQATGAGVLTYYEDHGQRYYILTSEVGGWDKGSYDAFSGGKEYDEKNPLTTASREFIEESMQLFPAVGTSEADAQHYINSNNSNTECIVVEQSKKMITYVTKVSKEDAVYFCNNFYKRRQQLIAQRAPWHLIEKDAVATIAADQLNNVIAQAKDKQYVVIKAQVYSQNNDGNVRIVEKTIKVRSCLVDALKPYCQQKKYVTGKNPKIRFY